MNFPKETLEGIFHTKQPFLESYGVPVIGRKFNYIPALTMDPPRALTEPMNEYMRTRKSEEGVLCDFPKYTPSGAINELWEDGDYNDIRRGMNADYEFNQATLHAKFKPSEVYEFMRADAERYTEETIKDFFASQYEDKEEQKRAFLMDYGVSPADAEQIMRQQKAEVASAALKEYIENKRIYRPMGSRIDTIARNYMRNDVPMVEANDYFSPDGNLVPSITGINLDVGAGRTTRGGPRSRIVARAQAEETLRDQAIDGLPVVPLSEVEKEMRMLTRMEQLDKGLAKVKADKAAKKESLQRRLELFSAARETKPARALTEVAEQTARFAEYRQKATGKGKQRVLEEFRALRPEIKSKGSGERILKSVASARGLGEGAVGRPMERLSTSLALVQQREAKTREKEAAARAERAASAQTLSGFFSRAGRGAGEK